MTLGAIKILSVEINTVYALLLFSTCAVTVLGRCSHWASWVRHRRKGKQEDRSWSIKRQQKTGKQ